MARKLPTDFVKSSLVSFAGSLLRSGKGFDERLGEHLQEVQQGMVYEDGKTFVDLMPAKRLKAIKDEYKLRHQDPNFDLREFITGHFYDGSEGIYPKDYVSDPTHQPLDQINDLWKFLERRNRLDRGSLLALPYPYIVPGGRFNEQFYWDSYFIMLGLAADNRWQPISRMMKNYAYEIRKYGYIPTANRSYLLSRSQPPFFSHMVRLLAAKKGKRVLIEYLPYLTAEYRFWMRGRSKLETSEHHAVRRVVQMPDGSLLNRYYDNKTTPRPESLREDIETAAGSGRQDSARLYLHIRAAAESGWDFSSRWFTDPADMRTIHTADIVPVDLNCLLYDLEMTIAEAYKVSFNPVQAAIFRRKGAMRAAAINKYLWNSDGGLYHDYNFHLGKQTAVQSLAGVFPLYVGIASPDQAAQVSVNLHQDFLKSGGLVSTTITNGQQWDAPNGWAPLQWVAIQGLRRYGDQLADTVTERWLATNEKVFATERKFVEKYDVTGGSGLGGGGEYVLQDGFGWTNGVYEALKRQFIPPLR